jgi:hypothetical protein
MCYNVEDRNIPVVIMLLKSKRLAATMSVLWMAIVTMALDGDYALPFGLFHPKARLY